MSKPLHKNTTYEKPEERRSSCALKAANNLALHRSFIIRLGYDGVLQISQILAEIKEIVVSAKVQAFVRNRQMLLVLQVATLVDTDHLNLIYWMEPRQLSPRQARGWKLWLPFDSTSPTVPENRVQCPMHYCAEPTITQARGLPLIRSITSSKPCLIARMIA